MNRILIMVGKNEKSDIKDSSKAFNSFIKSLIL